MQQLLKAALVGIFAFFALCTALAQDGPRYLLADHKAIDPADSHPLSYWTSDPIAIAKGNTLCIGCIFGNGRKVTKSDYRIMTKTHRIGQLAGHDVVELLYHFKIDIPNFNQNIFWRVVLATTKPGMYSEIYRLETEEDTLEPPITFSQIVKAGGEEILVTVDGFSGSGATCADGYWWFDQTGPHPVDFDPVFREIKKQLPKTSQYQDGCWSKKLEQQQIEVIACRQDPRDYRCLSGADDYATVVAHFTMHGATAVPLKIEITPDQ